MLDKNHISNIQIYTPEWDQARLGRFTSSKINALMGLKPFTDGALAYIDQKAAEFITQRNLATDDEIIEDENTVWGLQYEAEAINLFGLIKGLQYVVVQKMICDTSSRFSSTPDALWIIDTSVFQEGFYNVAPLEVKCPRKYPRFLPLYRCNTPGDLKKEDRKHYWQVLDQMDNCNSALGYYACYHPLFPSGKNIKIIEFRKIDLWDDFKLLQQRKKLALDKFNEVVSQFVT